MADTSRILIQDTLEKMKVYAPGVAMNAADGALGLAEMNQMLDQWSNQSLTCFANIEQSFPMVIGKNSYTIGTGGDINLTRPLSILTGPGAARLTDTNNDRYEMNVIEQDQWNQIGLLTETSTLPDTLFYDPQYPLGVINIFPTPASTYTVTVDSRLQLSQMNNLDTAFSLPPGYSAAIKNNLLMRLWSYYKQGDPTPQNREDAMNSLADIKRTNIKQSPATYDDAIVSKAQSSYNIYTDNTNRN